MKFNLKNKGFTMVELIIVMVLLGILAAVAIPRMGSTISSSEEASEDAVIGAMKSAIELYAMDQVVLNSKKSYPSNPFEQMDKTPEGYNENNTGDPSNDGEWTFNNSGNYVAHFRNDNTKYKWSYDYETGEFGARVDL
jgi:prepilin-type N-terminal cleavage/methylation domain-containing protein